MVQIGGWGSRSPFSRIPAISLAGIPSYGLVPNVISSQTVTPTAQAGGHSLNANLMSCHSLCFAPDKKRKTEWQDVRFFDIALCQNVDKLAPHAGVGVSRMPLCWRNWRRKNGGEEAHHFCQDLLMLLPDWAEGIIKPGGKRIWKQAHSKNAWLCEFVEAFLHMQSPELEEQLQQAELTFVRLSLRVCRCVLPVLQLILPANCVLQT